MTSSPDAPKESRYDNERKIVVIGGRSQSGKDTVGNHLVNRYGYERYAFADKLKESLFQVNPTIIVKDFEKTGFDMSLVQDTTASGGSVLQVADLVAVGGWDQAKQIPQVGKLLQLMGTEGGWMVHGSDVWVNLCEDQFESELPVTTPVVITDLRFPHEIDWAARRENAFTVRIQRPDQHEVSTRDGNHIGERNVNQLDVDAVLINDGTLEDLYAKVDALVETYSLYRLR